MAVIDTLVIGVLLDTNPSPTLQDLAWYLSVYWTFCKRGQRYLCLCLLYMWTNGFTKFQLLTTSWPGIQNHAEPLKPNSFNLIYYIYQFVPPSVLVYRHKHKPKRWSHLQMGWRPNMSYKKRKLEFCQTCALWPMAIVWYLSSTEIALRRYKETWRKWVLMLFYLKPSLQPHSDIFRSFSALLPAILNHNHSYFTVKILQ